MDRNDAGLAGLNAPSQFDRFGHWPRGLARVALGLLGVMLLLAAWAPGYSPPPPEPPKVVSKHADGQVTVEREDDNDLRLYRLIIARVQRGDNYYVAATEEQRNNNYPVAPGFTVRLPTLAFVSVWLGKSGLIALEIALFAALVLNIAWRFTEEPGGDRFRPLALGLMFTGIGSALDSHYNVLHEVWAAQLMTLSLVLHRPARGKWGAALLAAAAALTVRELTLPFVLLMAAYAGWHRRWREMAAWSALIAVFAAVMAVHLHFADAQVRPGDPASPSWLVLSGMSGLLYKVINSTALALLPVWIAGPVVILCLFGWTGWKSPLGDFATLLLGGYAMAFMIAGRDNNFYWGVLITPLVAMGAAFLPLSLSSLWRRATNGLGMKSGSQLQNA